MVSVCRLKVDRMTQGPGFLDSTRLRKGIQLRSFSIPIVNFINDRMSLRWLTKESMKNFTMSANG